METKKLGFQSGFSLWIATTFFLFISVILLTTSFQGRVSFQGVRDVNSSSASTIVSSWPFTIPASYFPATQPKSTATNAFGVVLGKVNLDKNGSVESVRGNVTESKSLSGAGISSRDGSSESVRRNVTESKSSPVTGVADAGQVGRSNNGYVDRGEDVKQSIDEDYYQKCDIFDGRWERDESKPYYPAGSCPHIDRDFNCHANGRPDSGFVKWRWQSNGCDIPRLNATDFLERLRGKKMVFVGDSLNRNMWESLVCILRHSISNKKKVHEISGKTEFKKKGFYAFLFEDYNCTVDFVGSPFLVRESSFSGANGTLETLRLDLMDKTTSMYDDADILVFNTGHWWTHAKTSKGEDYYQEGDYVHKRLKVLEAYKRALRTWSRWVDQSIDTNRTLVFFRGYSVIHFRDRILLESHFHRTHSLFYSKSLVILEDWSLAKRGGRWNSGGQCHKETEPIFKATHLAKYPTKMKVLENVLLEMKNPVTYLNISRLTDHRKDGHPSIYRMKYELPEELVAAERSQDCSHWCLPGVPDAWNELLYTSILKSGIGSCSTRQYDK